MKLITWITTGFGSGYSAKAPGTCGTLAASVLWIFCWYATDSNSVLLWLTTVTCIGGWWTTQQDLRLRETRDEITDDHFDPKDIVIDEWAGIFVTYLLAPFQGWTVWIIGFILFRIFDITKWGPVGRAEKFKGAAGIMADDIVAGLMAAICMSVLRLLWVL